LQRKTEKLLKTPFFKSIGFIGLALCTVVFLTAAKPANQEADVETCTACHENLATPFAANPHSSMQSCAACHGDATEHMNEGGGPNIFAFKAEDVANEKSEKCIICHTKTSSRFHASEHGKAAMDCTSCHSVHANPNPALLKAGATKSCLSCHEDIYALFQLNERHRLQEGILSCSSCHNPHEPGTKERMGGFKQQACLQCHTDKSGPYLFEHGASIIEGCTVCHEVHGSPNRHMLKQQSISDLCFSCHTHAVSWHSRFNSTETNCTVCHSTIHGSNLSKIFLK
jgi:DmsE family decaheme c-type cytochrome